ncbi:MAG: 30S ribosomal protein S2 [Anaerolineaceae bacterium]|nr:MAG: 30S ribosomal protein S2 [Anaerolineaceae bacterium]
MAAVSMKALLESGVHFGHRTNKWDPRMKPYIFTERNGIHIIDLQQTVKLLNHAFTVVRDTVANGGTVLFVGTKRQAQETVKEEAIRAGMPYVTERWLGGMLTNWSTIHQRILELDRLEKMRETGEINRLTKKEGLLIEREINRLLTRLEGVRNMKRLPDLLFLVDIGREVAAVREANLLKVPIVALVDTNCNPQNIDYVIPSNDDAIRAIKLLVARMADAVLEGKAMRKEEEPVEETPAVAAEKTADAKPSKARKSKRVVEAADVDEVGEGDLLGESTLAKLSVARKPEEKSEVAAAQPEAKETPEVVATPPEVKDEAGAAEVSAPAE